MHLVMTRPRAQGRSNPATPQPVPPLTASVSVPTSTRLVGVPMQSGHRRPVSPFSLAFFFVNNQMLGTVRVLAVDWGLLRFAALHTDG